MLEVQAIENVPLRIEMTEGEANGFSALGRELSAKTAWWGDSVSSIERSVIHVEELSGGRYKITFKDVVGAVRIGNHQIHIQPKIPSNHFWHIVSHSSLAPRISASPVSVAEGTAMIEVLALWCVEAAEHLLRVGLRKDYREEMGELIEVRGQIQPLATVYRLSQGCPVAVCTFEELSEDSPINRVVKSACERIAHLEIVNQLLRQRARRVAFRMDGVGVASYNDMRVRVERLTTSYAQVLPLALLILSGCGIGASSGHLAGMAFLVRTPEIIEDGLRSILAAAISEFSISKRKLLLGDSGLSINPDLVFCGDLAVGDVKYRSLNNSWSRADFNQIVTFATGFCCRHAAIVGFDDEGPETLPRPVTIGQVSVRAFGWLTASHSIPVGSQSRLVEQVRSWLTRIVETEPASV